VNANGECHSPRRATRNKTRDKLEYDRKSEHVVKLVGDRQLLFDESMQRGR
jgi:hypothetical protein